MKIDFNSLLNIIIIIILGFLLLKEGDIIVLPILCGTFLISYSFTRDVLNSLVLSTLLSYTLLILLYKRINKNKKY